MNQLFLVYFKSTVQETLMMEALNASDLNAVEQSRTSMLKYASEGLTRLDTLKPYQNDASLLTACRKVLEFQKSEADKITILADFLIKREEFEKIKKSYDTKPAAQRTRADVDAFNKAVAEISSKGNEFNKINGELNTNRAKVMNNWETTRKHFMDMHMPRKV
jgi:hypothetical protein